MLAPGKKPTVRGVSIAVKVSLGGGKPAFRTLIGGTVRPLQYRVPEDTMSQFFHRQTGFCPMLLFMR